MNKYKCTARGELDDQIITVVLEEWVYKGELVESIESSAEEYFYEAFDKHPFKIIEIEKLNNYD